MSQVRTFRYRIKGNTAALDAQARAVNLVWNYCNEAQMSAARRGKWLNWLDLHQLTRGATKEGLDLQSNTVITICRQYDLRRRKARKPWLRWRSDRSLGWVPARASDLTVTPDSFRFRRRTYRAWMPRPLPDGAKIGDGCFSRDARGRWYINIPVTLPASAVVASAKAVGIDLGLKALATLSDGGVIAASQPYRRIEARIASAQRAKKKRLRTALSAKAANQRRDHLHKASTRLAKEYGLIVVGGVSPAKLARTRMAKSVLDAGWSDFRHMISYKAIAHGGIMLEVDEAYTTQVCSECGSIGGPAGLEGLRVREWSCACGAVHDRDVNAAKNILRVGRDALAAGAAKAEASNFQSSISEPAP